MSVEQTLPRRRPADGVAPSAKEIAAPAAVPGRGREAVRAEAVARQQRGAQYYADKVASAPEIPARAQTETRAARPRAG